MEWYYEMVLVQSKYPLSGRFFNLEPLVHFGDEIASLPFSKPPALLAVQYTGIYMPFGVFYIH